MTVTALPVRDEYTGTSGQTIFNHTFLIFSNQDLTVYITPSGQEADDTADLTTAYTVNVGTIGNPVGGFITLDSGVSAGDLVTIISNIADNRTTDYQHSGDFLPDTVNDDFDRVVSLTKQQADRSGRTLSFPDSLQNATALTLSLPEAGLYLAWKGDESGVENVGAPGSVLPSELNGTTAQMVANASLSAGEYIITSGYGANGDGGDNTFLSRAVTGATADGGSLLKGVGNTAIEFVGLFPKDIHNVKQWGAVGDGVTDDYQAFVDADSFGKTIHVTDSTYEIGTLFSSTGTAAWVIDPNVQFTGTQPSFFRGVWNDHLPDGTASTAQGVNLHRLWDRVLIGDANLGYNGELGPGTTWPTDYGIGYYQAFSQMASFSSFGGLGMAGAAQSADTPVGSFATIGVAAGAVNNHLTESKTAWSFYGQTVEIAGAAGNFSVGMELNMNTEKTSGEVTPFNAESGIQFSATHWVGVGGEYPQLLSANCNPISCGMYFASNSYHAAVAGTGNLMRKGIVFSATVLDGSDGETGGRSTAIQMASGQQLDWQFVASTVTYTAGRIRADTLAINKATGIVFSNTGVVFMGLDASPGTTTETPLFRVKEPSGSDVNNLYVAASIAGQPVNLLVEGSDTNIDINIGPKGSGLLRIGTPFTSSGDVAVTGYMEVKDSAGTTRKLAIIA